MFNKLQQRSNATMQERGVRKQFLVVNGEPVLAFVAKPSQPNAVKFAQCDQHRFSSQPFMSYLDVLTPPRDITERVGCKPVEGAAGLSLNSTRDPTPGDLSSIRILISCLAEFLPVEK